MKKLIVVFLALFALSGCANRYWVAPAVVGGVVGYSLAQPRTVVVNQSAPVVEQVVVVNDACSNYPTYSERSACERGTRQRYYEEQRRRDQEAYRRGYGR
jgi:hypothetical protein